MGWAPIIGLPAATFNALPAWRVVPKLRLLPFACTAPEQNGTMCKAVHA